MIRPDNIARIVAVSCLVASFICGVLLRLRIDNSRALVWAGAFFLLCGGFAVLAAIVLAYRRQPSRHRALDPARLVLWLAVVVALVALLNWVR